MTLNFWSRLHLLSSRIAGVPLHTPFYALLGTEPSFSLLGRHSGSRATSLAPGEKFQTCISRVCFSAKQVLSPALWVA